MAVLDDVSGELTSTSAMTGASIVFATVLASSSMAGVSAFTGVRITSAGRFTSSLFTGSSAWVGGEIRLGLPTMQSAFIGKSTFSGSRIAIPDKGFSVSQAIKECLSLWGGSCTECAADSPKIDQALNLINACMQEIILKARGLQYLSKSTITITSLTETDKWDVWAIPSNVQNVVGNVMREIEVDNVIQTHELIGLSDISQLRNFNTIYQKPGSRTISGYYIDRTKSSSGADRASVNILATKATRYLTDYPAAEIISNSISCDVEIEATRYTVSDCRDGTIITLPHQYAESLLLPLIREQASSSPLAARRDTFEQYAKEAAAARERFGMADPQNPSLDRTEGVKA